VFYVFLPEKSNRGRCFFNELLPFLSVCSNSPTSVQQYATCMPFKDGFSSVADGGVVAKRISRVQYSPPARVI